MSHVQNTADLLYPTPETSIMNVKFFRGTNSEVTAEQLACQLEFAETQISNGSAVRVSNIDAE